MSRKRVLTADEAKMRRKLSSNRVFHRRKQNSRYIALESEIHQYKKKIESLRLEQKKISMRENNISVYELTSGECRTWKEFSVKKGIKPSRIWYAVKLAKKNKEQITLERLLEIIGSIKERGKKSN